jgi:hypothetical protein
MISNNQIKALSEDELTYLFYCCKSEWDSLNMGYEFNWYIMKAFKNNVIHKLLDKYSANLTDENKGLIMQILNKLETNI